MEWVYIYIIYFFFQEKRIEHQFLSCMYKSYIVSTVFKATVP